MKTTVECSDLQDPHAESRSNPGNLDDEIIRWADIFNDEITRIVDVCDGDTRLGSCTRRVDGQFEAHHANGRLIGNFPYFAKAFGAAMGSWRWTPSSDDCYGEVMVAVEGDQ
jgi:hypothetical protein